MKYVLKISGENFDPQEVIQALADEDLEFEVNGEISVSGDKVKWQLNEVFDPVKVDRRQLHAAALLITAFDLPQPITEAAASWLIASEIMPGATTKDVTGHNRKEGLEKAKNLIEEMLKEISG